MIAAVYRRFGAPQVVHVEQVPIPPVHRNDVLIKVYASTVSAADHRARSREVPRGLGLLATFGLGAFRPRHRILGMDVAGVVKAVGSSVTTFAPGDEVIAMLGNSFGGHAEYARIRQDGAIAHKPQRMSWAESVSLVFGGITALAFLRRTTLRHGTTVLVNGASGAVGTAAIQLAKQQGALVTGVCSAENATLVAALGADIVLDYTTTDFATSELTYDLIMDCVGNAPFERVIRSINTGGALLLVVASLKEILLASMRSRRSGRLISASAVTYTAEDLASLVALAESGQLQPVVDRTFPLTEIVAAHRYVDTGRKRGNVVLQISND